MSSYPGHPHISTESTPRSSVTALDREVDGIESRIEKYGADDPQASQITEKQQSPQEQKPDYVTWDGPKDPANPQNWSKGKKWRMTVLSSLATVNVTFASSSPSSTMPSMVRAFGISAEVSYLVTTVFLLGYVFGVSNSTLCASLNFCLSFVLIAHRLGTRLRARWSQTSLCTRHVRLHTVYPRSSSGSKR
jgi:hypothetical protein